MKRRASSTALLEAVNELSNLSLDTTYEEEDEEEDEDEVQSEPRPRGRERRRASLMVQHRRAPTMKEIRRGSLDWHAMIRPFVSDLAFRCLTRRRSESEISFKNWSGYAAVLFVDLSSYSKITAAIAHRGAHVLSGVTNAYFERLLKIVKKYGGDVIKFAGDAVLIVWEGTEEDLEINVLCAAQCAFEMQEKAGSHPVEGADLAFHIHCGLACGELDTEIFEAPTHVNMQRLYHSVGGDPLLEIAHLVDLAQPGEVCVSRTCAEFIGARGTYRRVGKTIYDCPQILLSLEKNNEIMEKIDLQVDELIRQREEVRLMNVEEHFIHPAVMQLLLLSGTEPTQIAQMRNLCVLFIGMTSEGNSVNWLLEIQGVLDNHRCPIIQIVDDDKGVHVVAAINLYESVPEASTIALDLCVELVSRQVGCAVGLALGASFCGVTGSATACRWDITGPPAVRAARLMQFALQHDLEIAIDQSVYDHSPSSFRLVESHRDVKLKGSPHPCVVYTLSDSVNFASNMILESLALASVHQHVVEKITDILTNPDTPRGAIVLTGPPLAGKKGVFQRAAGLASVVPVLHVCDAAASHLQLARTIATWFSYYQNEDVQKAARQVLDHLDNSRWSRAHDETIRLIYMTIVDGYCGCFVVDRCQFLDDFSISLMRECLDRSAHARPRVRNGYSKSKALSLSFNDADVKGRLFFLCTHVPLYHWKTANEFVDDLCRTRLINVPVYVVCESSPSELRGFMDELIDIKVEDAWLTLHGQITGHMFGYFKQRVVAVLVSTYCRMLKGETGISDLSDRLTLFIPPKMARKHKKFNVMTVDASSAMRFTQIYDELPPRYQAFMKILTVVTRHCFYRCPVQVLREALYDLIDEGIHRCTSMKQELLEMCLIKIEGEGADETVCMQCPAMADVVIDVCTPEQIRIISRCLIDRLEPLSTKSYKEPLVLAALCGNVGERERQKEFWRQGYKQLAAESKDWNVVQRCSAKELIEEEIEEAGCCPKEILGNDFSYLFVTEISLGSILIALKFYCAPISFGPMGHSLTVIIRNASHEILAFRGADEEYLNKLYRDSISALSRYRIEVGLIEDFLRAEGLGVSPEHIDEELKMLNLMVVQSAKEEDVYDKARNLFHEFVERFVKSRLERLYHLVKKLRQQDIPDFMQQAPAPIFHAYKAMRRSCEKNDGAQDALVTLAIMNWTPLELPEYLPVIFYQTTARLRNEVTRRLSEEELALAKHQHSADDLEAFLITTALALANETCYECRRMSLESARSSYHDQPDALILGEGDGD